MKTIAVDFDGVIYKFGRGFADGTLKEPPMPDSLKHIKLLIKKGYRIIVFTAREDFEPIREWLKKYKFPELEITNIKPKEAFIFIDDRAYRFTNWNDVYRLFP